MKKRILHIGLLLTLGVFVSGALMAQTEIINEGFESGIPSDWSIIDADGDGNNWTADGMGGSSFPGHGDDFCISSASYINNVGAQTPDNYLVTPELNLSSEGTLTFWVCAQDGNYSAEHYAVYASATGNQVDDFSGEPLVEETLASKSAKVTSAVRGTLAQGVWHEKTVTLPAGTKYVAFRHFDCTDNFWLNLDDVVITEETADGIEDVENMLGISIYPNPAKDFVQINIEDAISHDLSLQVYDMLGKLIESQIITEQTTQLNIKNLEKGVYILKIGNSTKRLIKN